PWAIITQIHLLNLFVDILERTCFKDRIGHFLDFSSSNSSSVLFTPHDIKMTFAAFWIPSLVLSILPSMTSLPSHIGSSRSHLTFCSPLNFCFQESGNCVVSTWPIIPSAFSTLVCA